MSHQPSRPSWDCDTCEGEKPWPCDPAREALAAEFACHRTTLAILMWGYLDDFIRDAGPGPFGEAYDRFMAWRPRPVLHRPDPDGSVGELAQVDADGYRTAEVA